VEPQQNTSDEELVHRIAAADRRALALLYDRHAPHLLALAQRMLGRSSEAEDLLHDVYMEVWRRAHTYSAERGTVRAWLTVRLRSRALDRRRRDRLARPGAEDARQIAERTPSGEEVTPFVDHAAVQRAVADLPAEQRVVLELFYFDGLSLPEIGERLTVPVGTVKSRASRALTRLRSVLSATDGPPQAPFV
jgi:RNA polymerase sigma-70 factor, ECF subfamily